jgi:hypothetical protein
VSLQAAAAPLLLLLLGKQVWVEGGELRNLLGSRTARCCKAVRQRLVLPSENYESRAETGRGHGTRQCAEGQKQRVRT